MVIYNPRIAIRKEATADGAIVASLALGTKVRGTPFKNDVGEWIKLSDDAFSMIAHEKLGKLLESRPDAAALDRSAIVRAGGTARAKGIR